MDKIMWNMQYTLYSLLRKHGEVMSEKSSKNHVVGYIQNGNCHMSKLEKCYFRKIGNKHVFPKALARVLACIVAFWFNLQFLFTSLMPTLVLHGFGGAVPVCRCCKTTVFTMVLSPYDSKTIVFVSPMRGLIQKQQFLQRFWAHTIPKPLFL